LTVPKAKLWIFAPYNTDQLLKRIYIALVANLTTYEEREGPL